MVTLLGFDVDANGHILANVQLPRLCELFQNAFTCTDTYISVWFVSYCEVMPIYQNTSCSIERCSP